MSFLLHKFQLSKRLFWTSNLDHLQILGQLSYERVIYVKRCLQASLFDCKNKIGSICTLSDTTNNPPRQGLIRPLVWWIVYSVAKCTDTPNFTFAIKQRGLETTFDLYNSLIAQLTQDLRMIKVGSQKNHGQNVIFISSIPLS